MFRIETRAEDEHQSADAGAAEPGTKQNPEPDGEGRVHRLLAELLRRFPPGDVAREDFLGAQFDAGLAWVHHPEGCGGLGLAERHQEVVDRTLREAGAPTPNESQLVGVSMATPVIVKFGSPAQKQRYLRPIFTGEEIWCQLFSEPGAGSDLAALSTMAVAQVGHWIINGQKVWTSFARLAQFGLLVARTDPDAPKHRGLTYFILDMKTAGVEVRPLRQLTGEAEFNEVFMTDVRVPDRDRVGDVNNGWKVVLATLANERAAIGGSAGPQDADVLAAVLRTWKATDRQSTVHRDRVVGICIDAECLRLTTLRAAEEALTGISGPASAVRKLAVAQLHQRATELCTDLLGPTGIIRDSPYGSCHEPSQSYDDPRTGFLRARALSIAGGTSEIMRNILAERVLGLPPDPSIDRNLPWRMIPRS